MTSGRPNKKRVPSDICRAIAERDYYDMKIYEYATSLFNHAMARDRHRVREEVEAIARVKKLPKMRPYYFRGLSAARKAISRVHSYI